MDAYSMVAHGALDHAELAQLGMRPDQICDFSSNINPFGPPAVVRQALAELDPAPYPDRSCYQLRRKIAEIHQHSPASILIGNGSNELIHLIGRALLRPSDRSLVVEPTFGEYAHAARLAAAHVVSWRAEEPSFQIDVELLCFSILRHRPRLVWLCSPNNPTGVRLSETGLSQLAETCAAVDGWLVLDRTYAAFGHGCDPEAVAGAFFNHPNMLQLHSLTKSYALAGLRIGYLLAEEGTIQRIAYYQPTWSVGSAAQVAGLAALEVAGFLRSTMAQLWHCSDKLHSRLQELGADSRRQDLPFLLVRTGDGAATRMALMLRGCAVRDCTSFGLPAYVRVAPRDSLANEHLVHEWERLVAEGDRVTR